VRPLDAAWTGPGRDTFRPPAAHEAAR
jgi:hypothetical protein